MQPSAFAYWETPFCAVFIPEAKPMYRYESVWVTASTQGNDFSSAIHEACTGSGLDGLSWTPARGSQPLPTLPPDEKS